MKPIITWVVLANAQTAHVVANTGPGKGFLKVQGQEWQAAPPIPYSDEPGVGKNSHGPGQTAKTRRDPNELAELKFAAIVADNLGKQHRAGAFERLVLVAAPRMLGILRAALDKGVQDCISAELDKDLTKLVPGELAKHLANVMAP